MEITDFRADYHRNGVGGERSYVCFFRVTDADLVDEGALPMMAVLWGRGDDDNPTEAMVMRLSDVASVCVAYLDGATPDHVDDHPRDDPASIYLGAYRSTDRFLPQLRALLDAEMDRKYASLRARFGGRT